MRMGLSCGARTLKFSLFIFNLVFLICGFVCLCIGTWLILDKYAVDNLAAATAKVKGYENDDGLRDLATKPAAVRQIGYLLLFGGIVVIIVAFLGCCGAAKEWRPLLCCYGKNVIFWAKNNVLNFIRLRKIEICIGHN
uniref:Uncharacterized protein n=1 Tax=Panagrolaimus davidi TaxID=227884 RepID=A0A914QJ88_9BILA